MELKGLIGILTGVENPHEGEGVEQLLSLFCLVYSEGVGDEGGYR